MGHNVRCVIPCSYWLVNYASCKLYVSSNLKFTRRRRQLLSYHNSSQPRISHSRTFKLVRRIESNRTGSELACPPSAQFCRRRMLYRKKWISNRAIARTYIWAWRVELRGREFARCTAHTVSSLHAKYLSRYWTCSYGRIPLNVGVCIYTVGWPAPASARHA